MDKKLTDIDVLKQLKKIVDNRKANRNKNKSYAIEVRKLILGGYEITDLKTANKLKEIETAFHNSRIKCRKNYRLQMDMLELTI